MYKPRHVLRVATCRVVISWLKLYLPSYIMDADAPLFPPAVTAAPLHKYSSERKRKRQACNALPRIFLFCQASSRRIGGAMIVTECAKIGVGTLQWVVSAVCLLAQHFMVDRAQFKFRSNISQLTPTAELQVRSSNVVAGGSLNHNFSDYADCVWKVWDVDDETWATLVSFDGLRPAVIRSPEAYATNLGVTPQAHLTTNATVLQTLEDAAGSASGVCAPGSSENSANVNPPVAQDALDHLESMSKEKSGSVTHVYKVQTIWSSLQLASKLKPSVKLCDALADSAEILLPERWHASTAKHRRSAANEQMQVRPHVHSL